MKKIAIFNQKGGVGKSSLAVNLSASLSKTKKKKILVIDCDAQGNTSSYLLSYGHDNDLKYNLVDYMSGNVGIEECVYPVFFNIGKSKENIIESTIDILPVDERLDSVDFDDIQSIKKITDVLEKDYDYCFLDCSPQKTPGVMLALCAADFVLVPMDAGDIDSIQGWNMVLSLVEELKDNQINPFIRILGVVVNFFNKNRAVHNYMYQQFEDTFGDVLFKSSIRDSADIEQAKIWRQPVCYYKPSCMVSKDYDELVREFENRLKKKNRKAGK